MRLEEAQRQVQARYAELFRVGQNLPADYLDCCPLGDGRIACVTAIYDRLGDAPRRPIGVVTAEGGLEPFHPGPAKLLEPSRDGMRLAFAIDGVGGDSLIIAKSDGAVEVEHKLADRIEQIEWGPGDTDILLLVADQETDTTTLAGSTSSRSAGDDGQPGRVHDEARGKRRVLIYTLETGQMSETVDIAGTIWEATWSGHDHVVGLWSADPSESGWYRPALIEIDLKARRHREIYRSNDQIGHLRGRSDGATTAFVEAVASDRGIVAGALMLLDTQSGAIQRMEALDFDISSVRWREDRTLHLAGVRGLETVVGDFDPEVGRFDALWSSAAATFGAPLPVSRPVSKGRALAVIEAPNQPPRPCILEAGATTPLGPEYTVTSCAEATGVSWPAPDGETIEGVLLCPKGVDGPLPLVFDVHGGPVWVWRPCWQGRLRSAPLLLALGAAVLLPNPRGSLGRGRDFAAAVLGENGGMGGPEMGDFEAAIDSLASRGLIDPLRVGLTGSSYGGYIAAWLPKLRPDIAAAAPISPVTDWFGQHLASNIPALEEIFLGGRPTDIPERYISRSPALSPNLAPTPTLILAGELDRCVPLTQALQLHRALSEQGAPVALVTYPAEGHSLRGPAGYLDSAARVLAWMVDHLGLGPAH